MNKITKNPTSAAALSVQDALSDLRSARTLGEIGEQLEKLSGSLEAAKSWGADLTVALRQSTGLRPFTALTDGAKRDVSLFLGSATVESARRRAAQESAESPGARIENHDFQTFSTGDPFVFLGKSGDSKKGVKAEPADVKGRSVFVTQGDVNSPENKQGYDRATLVAEAMQMVLAAKQNEAKEVTLVLPSSLDPARHPTDRFVELVTKLVKDTPPSLRPDNVVYASELDAPKLMADGVSQRSLRPGLESLGPKFQSAVRGLQLLDAATNLSGVQRALSSLSIELKALSKFENESKALTSQVIQTLTAKVQSLVPGIPKGAAGNIDDKTVVFAGQSNPALSKDIAKTLEAELGETCVHFEGGVPFSDLATPVNGRPVVVVQTSREDPGKAENERNSSMALLAEALMLCDEAQRQGAEETTLVLPYMPNARSDKKDQDGVGTYAKLVAGWVGAVGVENVVLIEPHDPHVPDYFFGTRSVRVISGAEVLTQKLIEDIGGKDDLMIAWPDAGAKKRTEAMAKKLGFTDDDIISGEKTRSDNTENAKVETLKNAEAVVGKRVMVTDDEIATGGTMRQVVENLKYAITRDDDGKEIDRQPRAKEVIVAVSHANMPDTLDKRHDSMRALRDAGADKLYLLDTQPIGALPADLKDFVRVVSAADAISDKVF